MKKTVLATLVILTLISLCATINTSESDASSTFELDGFTYSVNGTTLSVTSYDGRSADPVIPGSIINDGTTYKVDSVSARAFEDMSTMHSVTIPSSVGILYKYAFSGCTGLSEVHTSGPLEIGEGAFYGCASLGSFTIYDGTESIGSYAFRDCSSLESMTIPDSVTYVGTGAFKGCTSLSEVTLSGSEDTVYAETFADCTSLEYIRIPAKTTYVLDNAFRGCTSLSVVDICSTVIDSSSLRSTSFAIGSEGNESYCTINCVSPYFDYTKVTDQYTHITMNGSEFTITTYDSDTLLDVYTYHAGDITDVSEPERKGYHVSGWNPSVPSVMTVGDIVTTAVWEANTYRVIFHSNDGLDEQYGVMYTYNYSARLVTNQFVYEYHVFTGWSTDPDAATPEYRDGEMVLNLSDSADVHLYAIWKDADFTIVFDANGGEGSMTTQSFEKGVQQRLLDNAYTRTGYLFQGWSYSRDSVTPEFYDEEYVSDLGTGTVTLYAVWEPIRYTVVFELEGGTGLANKAITKYDDAVALPDEFIEKTGYVLKGWSSLAGGEGEFYPRGSAIYNLSDMNGSTVTLYACWISGTISIVYENNGGKGYMDSLFLKTGESAKLGPCSFTKTHSVFLGWSYSPYGSVDLLDGMTYTNTTSKTMDLRLYAVWEFFEYDIVFDSNGGDGEMSTITMPYGNTFDLPACTFTNDGREFLGWSDRPDGDVIYNDCASVKDVGKGAGSVTLYAVWKADEAGFPVVIVGLGAVAAIATIGVSVFVIRRR